MDDLLLALTDAGGAFRAGMTEISLNNETLLCHSFVVLGARWLPGVLHVYVGGPEYGAVVDALREMNGVGAERNVTAQSVTARLPEPPPAVVRVLEYVVVCQPLSSRIVLAQISYLDKTMWGKMAWGWVADRLWRFRMLPSAAHGDTGTLETLNVSTKETAPVSTLRRTLVVRADDTTHHAQPAKHTDKQ